MTCPLCRSRKARRACPALGESICAVCCGTKRLTEIKCPSTCPYLISAREHPPAAVVRQQQQDVNHVVRLLQDLNERQSRAFLLIAGFFAGYKPPDLQTLLDIDVVDAAGTLASTLETADRGVIYEHRAGSMAGERLVSALKPFVDEMRGKGGLSERDLALILRRIEQGGKESSSASGRGFVELVSRVVRPGTPRDETPSDAAPRLIVP